MKSQFVKFNTQQGSGNGDVPDHIVPMNKWSSVSNRNDSGANQPQQSQKRPTSGLLSNWNAGDVQGPQPQRQAGAQQSNFIVEQDTLEQRIVQPPAQLSQSWQLPQPQQPLQTWQMGPVAQPVNPHVFMNGPISPRESGITSHSAIFPNEPVPPAMQTLPVQQPASQPLYPPMYGGPNNNAPVMPGPGYAQVPMQPMGGNGGYGGYPGAGGPPYIYPPVSPGGNGGRGGGWAGGGQGKRPEKKRRYPMWARVVTVVMVLLMLAAGGAFAYYQINFAPALNRITDQQVKRAKGEEDPNQGRTGDILSGQRINILLLGSDTDQKFGTSSGGATVYLAQTDIIVTIDPASQTVGMLSIPRDFYINIPGYGMGKLDEAFEHGYGIGQGGFAGAVDLSRQTI